MFIGNFGATIAQGRETSEGYVKIKHNTEYRVCLRNNGKTPCDAILSIDGSIVGTYRIDPFCVFPIERPPSIERKFVFLKLGTLEALQADLQRNDKLGLITVEFIPAPDVVLKSLPPVELYNNLRGHSLSVNSTRSGSKGASAGGTGLGSHSDQKFKSAEAINHDYSKKVTINLRLVCIDEEPAIIPLRSNPVPPSLL